MNFYDREEGGMNCGVKGCPACEAGALTRVILPESLLGGGGTTDRGQSHAEDMDQAGRFRPTAQERLFANHDMLCAKSKAILEAKNKDYASADDPYRNFRMFGPLGILVRMSDKLARLRNFVENGSYTVKDEGVVDTTCDLINYANILYSYLEEDKRAG